MSDTSSDNEESRANNEPQAAIHNVMSMKPVLSELLHTMSQTITSN